MPIDIGHDLVVIRDCGPRDGLQGEAPVAASKRAELVCRLANAGLPEVEVAAFVSPRAVPAMAGAADVVRAVPDGICRRWVLVPNRRGAELAIAADAGDLTVTVSASPQYSVRNVGMSVNESLDELVAILGVAGVNEVDVVVSCAFGSPFGDVILSDVQRVVSELKRLHLLRITLADTTGAATPRRLERVLAVAGTEVGLHVHDTRGTGS